MLNIEIIRLSNDLNLMLRVEDQPQITMRVLEDIEKQCRSNFKTAAHQDKGAWHRMACYAEAIRMNKRIPYSGLPVIGPFIGSGIMFPEAGEVIDLNAGIEVFSDMPSMLGKTHHERVPRKVRVHEVSAGYVNMHQIDEVVDPMIVWKLKEGCMAWTSVKNINEAGIVYEVQEVA